MWKQLGKAALRFILPLSLVATAALMGWEGFRSMPYQDQAGVWTDGYGNTQGVKPGVPVTREQAERKMLEHVDKFQAGIDACLYRGANQGQSDAYTLLAYNIGVAAFCNSSIATLHNDGRFVAACNAILLYNKIRINGKLTYSRGLANRRTAERELCLKDL